MKILSIVMKNQLKPDIELFSWCTIWLKLSTLGQIFCLWLSLKTFVAYDSPEASSYLNRLPIFATLRPLAQC